MQGYNVLHPMGWDAFGLPAEQYAIETGMHPKITTMRNIERFRSQLKSLGFSYDWDREISTVEPDYYRWTQWIFLQLLKRGLAYQAEIPVNWCPALGTVLANEEVVDGVSERGGHPVIRKPMQQWMLKITAYADRLLEDLDDLDWPENVKEMQRNWIGRSEGAEVEFCVLDAGGRERDIKINIYTTRPDTIFGATYLVLAPEHFLLSSLLSEAQSELVEEYKELSSRKSDLERTELQKEKTGVFSGCYARNPVNGEAIPIWVADYVLGSYGTGAIMAVPAHDSRDHEFALKYDIPIRWVVCPSNASCYNYEKSYSGEGTIMNSSSSALGLDINGLPSNEAALKVIEWAEKTTNGKKMVNYKLRDWLFARQRYWGEPIPVIFLEGSDEVVPIPENELPLRLPELDDFTPTGTGEPPLSKAVSWVKTIDPSSGKPARRETNTMPQWAGSCWYYLRFMDPKNDKELVDKTKEKYWSPVDVYVGGAEHAVLHLLYSRFWHKILYDIGVVSTKEPFKCVINQGILLGEVQYLAFRDQNGNFISADNADLLVEYHQEIIPDEKIMKLGNSFILKDNPNIHVIARAQKMSKSRGNVVNPDDVVTEYGADSLRLYEMFMGPLRDSKSWNTSGIEGVHRFLARTWRLIVGLPSPDGTFRDGTVAVTSEPTLEQLCALHKCIDKVTGEIEGTRFNTGISAMMEFINAAYKWDEHPKSVIEAFVLLLSPYAPHIAEELWLRLGHQNSLAYESFPKADPAYLKNSTVVLPVQINGKMRGTVQVEEASTEEDAFRLASLDEKLSKYLDGKTTKKIIYVPGKILNVILDSQNVKVVWGESSMIEAERLLLESALEDPANQRFVLLSDSCVPLYNFSYIYNYLLASPRSFVDSFLDTKDDRYNPRMSPIIPKGKWRKGSQWVTLVRSHAVVVVEDIFIFPVFKKFCKRRPPIDASKGALNIKLQKQHNCIPDEHYVQTLLSMNELDDELERRTLTYTVWNLSASNMERKGWHPKAFYYANAGPQNIKEIKDINHVYYETEFRTEWCQSGSEYVPCFLFARKFSRGAAKRLLSDGVVGPFDASALLDLPL